jgi:hypothetical protein
MVRIPFTRRDGVIMLRLRVCVGAALAVIITSVGPVSAQPAGRVKVGTLACQLSPSVGYVVGSRQALTCRFKPEVPRPSEVYVGAIKTAGLDIGVKTGGAMLWAVFAPVNGYYRGAPSSGETARTSRTGSRPKAVGSTPNTNIVKQKQRPRRVIVANSGRRIFVRCDLPVPCAR